MDALKLIKERLMVVRDAGIGILITLAIISIIGYGISHVLGQDDTAIEEHAETYLEDVIEDILGAEDDEFDGTIDFTPESRESVSA